MVSSTMKGTSSNGIWSSPQPRPRGHATRGGITASQDADPPITTISSIQGSLGHRFVCTSHTARVISVCILPQPNSKRPPTVDVSPSVPSPLPSLRPQGPMRRSAHLRHRASDRARHHPSEDRMPSTSPPDHSTGRTISLLRRPRHSTRLISTRRTLRRHSRLLYLRPPSTRAPRTSVPPQLMPAGHLDRPGCIDLPLPPRRRG